MESRFKEHTSAIKNPHIYHSRYAKHILQHNHKHNTIENIHTILKSFKDNHLNIKENVLVHKHKLKQLIK